MSSGIRITGGALRGRRLEAPSGIRPTSGRVRESLMNIWASRLRGARFLDLFAGTGAVGIEAISRGADEAVLIEGDRDVYTILTKNCAKLVAEQTLALELVLPGGMRAPKTPNLGVYDLIFADPPYEFEEYPDLLAVIAALLKASGVVALEHSCRVSAPAGIAGLNQYRSRRYGDTGLSFYQSAENDQS